MEMSTLDTPSGWNDDETMKIGVCQEEKVGAPPFAYLAWVAECARRLRVPGSSQHLSVGSSYMGLEHLSFRV